MCLALRIRRRLSLFLLNAKQGFFFTNQSYHIAKTAEVFLKLILLKEIRGDGDSLSAAELSKGSA